MRRIITAALVLTAALVMLAGCAGGANPAPTGSNASSSSGSGASSSATGAPGSASTPAPAPVEGAEPMEIVNGTATLDGVTVTLVSATMAPVTSPPGYRFDIEATIQNNSSEPVMAVTYSMVVRDVNGEEIRSFRGSYDQEVSAIAPGETVNDPHYDLGWGPNQVPASVELELRSVTSEFELPAARLPQKGEYLYEALGDEHLANIRNEPPVELRFHIDQGGYGRTATLKEGGSLNRAVELLCDVKIGDDTGEFVTDNYNFIGLTWADGSTTSLSLNLYNLEFSAHPGKHHSYELENLGPLWSYCEGLATEDGAA